MQGITSDGFPRQLSHHRKPTAEPSTGLFNRTCLQPKQGHAPSPTPPLKLKPIQMLTDCYRNHLFPCFTSFTFTSSVPKWVFNPWHGMLNISSTNNPPSHQTLPQILHANKEHTFLACLFLVWQCEAHKEWKSTRGGKKALFIATHLPRCDLQKNWWALYEKLLLGRKGEINHSV